MKSSVFYSKHNMKIEEREIPTPREHEVIINVKVCGICGTDVHIYEGDPGSADVTKPTVLGHEFSGIITEVGESVTNFKVGDRVTVDPNWYCGKCTPCRDGVVHYCENMLSYGVTIDGGFSEYCAVNETVVYKIGDNTSYEQAAMVEPLGCCLHGIDMCEIKAGDKVVVIGGGMIGLLMMQLAKLEGASKVALLEPVESKRKVALEMGADICIDPISQDAKEELKKAGFNRVNVVIECVGRTNTIKQAMEIAGYKSIVMMFGLTKPDETIDVKPFELFKKEIVLKASFINPCTHQRALDLIDGNRVDVISMIYEVAGLSELENILSDAKLRANGKYLIDPAK
ncbi:MAG: zinc-dependent alcohol dehydrogenase family protein [Clostridia bacterium]